MMRWENATYETNETIGIYETNKSHVSHWSHPSHLIK
jgi:hypothetical protein